MAIFITASRWALQQPEWVAKLGPTAIGLQGHFADSERRIWTLVEETLTEQQTELLRELIARWLATGPGGIDIATVRFRNLEGADPADFRKEKTARGLLACVRRWLGEVNTSLLLGERMLFYVERTPRILSQQTDLTLAQIAHDFPIATVRPDFPALTDYLEELPEKVFGRLDEIQLPPDSMWGEVRQTLGGTRELIASSTRLLDSANALTLSLQNTLDRYEALAKSDPQPGEVELDYQLLIAQLAAALQSLDSAVQGVNVMLAADAAGGSRLEALVGELESRSQAMVDHLFYRAALLLGIFLGGSAALLVLAWWLFRRPAKTPPAAR